MADYTKITDFAAKDALLSGNPAKIISGTAHDNEYNAIAVAIATKYDSSDVGTGASNIAAGDHVHTGVYQTVDAELTALAGLTSAANKLPYFTGSGTAALADLTSAGRALIDDADAAAQRVTLNVQGILAGQVVQASQVSTTTPTGSSNVIPMDGSIPQSTEGDQLFIASITPTIETNKLRVTAVIPHGSTKGVILALFRDSGADAVAACYEQYSGTTTVLRYEVVAGSTSATTFKLRFGVDATGTVYVNASDSGTSIFSSGLMHASMSVEEIQA